MKHSKKNLALLLTSFTVLAFSTNIVFAVQPKSTLVDEKNTNAYLREVIKEDRNQLLCAQNEIAILQEKIYDLRIQFDKNKKLLESLQNQKALLKEALALKTRNESSPEIEAYKAKILMLENNNSKLLERLSILTTSKNEEKAKLENQIKTYSSQISELNLKVNSMGNNKQMVGVNLSQKTNFLTGNSANINDMAMKYLSNDRNNLYIYHVALAKAYQSQKDYENAAINYCAALKAAPSNYKVYGDLGIAYAEQGDYKNAIKSFENYLKSSNNPAEIALVKSFINKLTLKNN